MTEFFHSLFLLVQRGKLTALHARGLWIAHGATTWHGSKGSEEKDCHRRRQ